MQNRFKTLILGATALAAASGIALAQQAAPAAPAAAQQSPYDLTQLPATQGKITRFTLTPRGDVDGFILADGTEVHLPPPMSAQVVALIKPGDSVTVHGLKARAISMVDAMSVTNDATGKTLDVVGHGPKRGPHGPGPRRPEGQAMQQMQDQGQVQMALHGPRGEVNGALLADGTIVRLPPPEAAKLASMLAAGQSLVVQGRGMSNDYGKVIAAREIGPSATQLTQIAFPHPHGRRGHKGRDHEGRDRPEQGQAPAQK